MAEIYPEYMTGYAPRLIGQYVSALKEQVHSLNLTLLKTPLYGEYLLDKIVRKLLSLFIHFGHKYFYLTLYLRCSIM